MYHPDNNELKEEVSSTEHKGASEKVFGPMLQALTQAKVRIGTTKMAQMEAWIHAFSSSEYIFRGNVIIKKVYCFKTPLFSLCLLEMQTDVDEGRTR